MLVQSTDTNPLGEFAAFKKINVLPGHFHITASPTEVIGTLLGSCVAACVRDSVTGLGGLNHFLLPAPKDEIDNNSDAATRYGDAAMNALIGGLIRRGARRENLEIKVFGGANLFPVSHGQTVGDSNQKFICEFIKNEGLKLVTQHLGGNNGRRIFYHPHTGKVKMQLMPNQRMADILRHEAALMKAAEQSTTQTNDIELF